MTAVLRVARLSDPGARYHLHELARSRWVGSGAEALGLAGAPDAASLRAVLSGSEPRSGLRLVARQGPVRAYDLVFAAPKSVSVLFALGEPRVARTVASAQRAAVEAAFGYLESRGAAVRRSTGAERRPLRVRGTVAAAFEHSTSRALDPHVHTHVVVGNTAQGEDGRWSALDGRGLYAHARAAGALYDAHLRHRLTKELGVAWEARASGAYELVGAGAALLASFSARQAQIREHLFALAPATRSGASPSGRARTVAWGATREPKAAEPPLESLRAGWRARAAAESAQELERFDGIPRRPGLAQGDRVPGAGSRPAGVRDHALDVLDEHRFASALHGTERTGVARRDVVAAWAGAVASGSPGAAVEACVASLVRWGEGVGVAEERQSVAAVSVRRHHVAALGPRPSDPGALETWRAAAHALDRYRSRWRLEDPREPTGVRDVGAHLSTLPALRLAELLEVRRTIDDARRRLGRAPGLTVRADALVVEPPGRGIEAPGRG